LGGPADPHPHRHRRLGAERALPAPQPRPGVEDPPGAPLRARAAEAKRREAGARGVEGGYLLGEPDPVLRDGPLPPGQGSADGRGDLAGRQGAGRRDPALPRGLSARQEEPQAGRGRDRVSFHSAGSRPAPGGFSRGGSPKAVRKRRSPGSKPTSGALPSSSFTSSGETVLALTTIAGTGRRAMLFASSGSPARMGRVTITTWYC